MNTEDTYRLGQIAGAGTALGNYNPADPEQWREDSSVGERNSRQFSTFDFLAHMINSESEELQDQLWAAYDDGVADGINIFIKEHTRGTVIEH